MRWPSWTQFTCLTFFKSVLSRCCRSVSPSNFSPSSSSSACFIPKHFTSFTANRAMLGMSNQAHYFPACLSMLSVSIRHSTNCVFVPQMFTIWIWTWPVTELAILFYLCWQHLNCVCTCVWIQVWDTTSICPWICIRICISNSGWTRRKLKLSDMETNLEAMTSRFEFIELYSTFWFQANASDTTKS